MMCGVSVVVPVFNAEGFLPRVFACFDAQVFRDFEVVFVDDGSTDGSFGLLEEYASCRENVVIIRQENRGAGAARNRGIAQARGEYIAFVDADDCVTPTFLSYVYAKAVAEDADIVIYGYALIHGDKVKILCPAVCDMAEFEGTSVISWHDDPERILTITGEQATVGRIYRRSFLVDKDLRFPEISALEDWPFSLLAIVQAERIAWLREALYIYIRSVDNASLTAQRKAGYKLTALQACKYALHNVQKLPHYEEIRLAVWDFIAKTIHKTVAFYGWNEYVDEEMKEFLTRVPRVYRVFGITDKDIDFSIRKDAASGILTKALLERPIQEIIKALELPFVLVLRANAFEDVVPVLEAEKARRSTLDFQFSGVEVYLPAGECEGGVSVVPVGLMDVVASGWLRIRSLSEDCEGEWFVEALKNNSGAHCVFGTASRVACGRLNFDCLVAQMLASPGSVVAGATRTMRLADGSVVEPGLWLETETMAGEASGNLWMDTSRYVLVPCGVFDIERVLAVCDSMPPSVRADEEYVLNGVLQACGVPVASARYVLPDVRDIGGSGSIKDIDTEVLEWIDVNRVSVEAGGGYTREEYCEMLNEAFERQSERNWQRLDEAYAYIHSREADSAAYHDAHHSLKALAHGVVLSKAHISPSQ